MAPYRNSSPPDWAGWGGDTLYYPPNDPLSGGYQYADDYDDLTVPVPSAPPRSTTPFGQFLPSILEAAARRPQPAPFGQFLPSIGVHLPPPQSVLATRRYDPPSPPLIPLELPADYASLTEPAPMVGPQSGERVAGFGSTPARLPTALELPKGDGPWRNAAAGLSEAFYGALGGAVDDQVDSINSQIEYTNYLLGRNDPYISEDQILGSRWFAREAEDRFGVPDPARVRAVSGWEQAARTGGVVAGHLAALLLSKRAPATATRRPSLPNVHPPRLGTGLPGHAPGRVTNPIEGTRVLFGQRRVNETFSLRRPDGSGPPSYLAGRRLEDVAEDLHLGRIHTDQLPILAFRHGNDLVSINTRSLSALSLARKWPTNITLVKPDVKILRRLREQSLIPEAPLPGPRVPMTPSRNDLTVLRIIEVPGEMMP